MWGRGILRRRRRHNKRRSQPYRSHYLKHKELARRVISERVTYYAETYSFTYGRIAIRNSRGSWGSCSSAGNLNFHYRLLFLAPEVRDYVIVHELCHLRVFNHSQDFWTEVEDILPNYKQLRTDLKICEKQKTLHAMIVT